MTRLAIVTALCALSTACASAGRISVRPGTDMALPAPDSSAAAPIIAGAICIVASRSDAEKSACTTAPEGARAVGPAPATNGHPRMRARTSKSVFRRG